MTSRVVLHADMDAFYASIEQRDNPDYRGKPVIVGGTSARGVVSAASYEARRFGVRSAMPGFRARELCPAGIFVAGDMARYAEASRLVRVVFEEFTPIIEPLALDEAFLDITGSVALFGGVRQLAQQLKARVRQQTSLAVSVGVAPSKLVAKIACTLSKPDGLRIIPASEVQSFLAELPLRRLWGVGPVLGERLAALELRTIGDLAGMERTRLARVVGAERAAELQSLARGQDNRPVESGRAAKSYGEENTFEHDVSDSAVLEDAITGHAEAVARRLRRDDVKGRTISLKLTLARARGRRSSRLEGESGDPIYPVLTRSRTLPDATSDGMRIREVAVALYRSERLREPVRLVGVSVSSLEQRGPEQLSLFEAPRKADRLGAALDAITDRFGKHAIGRAVRQGKKATPSDAIKPGEE